MHEVIGLRPDTERFILCGTGELGEKHFFDLESLGGRIRANDVKGIQHGVHVAVPAALKSLTSGQLAQTRSTNCMSGRCKNVTMNYDGRLECNGVQPPYSC